MRSLCVSVMSVAVSLLACAAEEAAGQPKEGPEPKVDTWLLDFKPLDIKPIVVERASGRGRLDWYLVYAVTNRDGEPRPFEITISAESDKGVKYSDSSMPETERAVERALGEDLFGTIDREKHFPLAEQKKALDEIRALQGDAQIEAFRKYLERKRITIKPKETKRCIATFGALDREADFVKIYVRNLTGTIVIKEKEGAKVLEEHVLVLEYRIPGDEFGQSQDRFEYVGRQWIKVEREVAPAAKK
ncbi:MAG TPA: hypothetical protein DCM87_21580 [Planctomycetes bacterium]|nr:hypothetical protein [Planctomycetota bacterium]